MIIRPLTNHVLLGACDHRLDADTEYEATWATNQPNWQDARKVFANGILLSQGEYVITTPDRPLSLFHIANILRSWVAAVDVPRDPVDGCEDGELVLTDDAMLELIGRTNTLITEVKANIPE